MAARSFKTEDILTRIDELPTLPTVVYELSQVINDPMSSTTDVEKIMAGDQSLTTKVLKLVNSAYYAIPGGVSSVGRAIGYLGFDTVNQLVLSTSILEALAAQGRREFDLSQFWKHSLGVAVAAETIAKYSHHPMPTDVFTCGLVHDMGKVALYTIEAETMLSIVARAREKGISYYEAEDEFEVPKHPTIGHLLAQKWALPGGIQASIKYHHQPDSNLRGGLPSNLNRIVDIVYLANLLIHALKFGNSGHDKILGAPKEGLERLGLNADKDLKPLLLKIKKNLEAVKDLLQVLGILGS